MSLQVFRERAQYSKRVCDFFDFDQLDAFHCQAVLSVIYGDAWESILIVDGNQALLHSYSKKRIDDTPWYDIEPLVGYSGPIVNTDNNEFINLALKRYSEICREDNIIAEIIRFNPLLQNHTNFLESSSIEVFSAKDIIIVNCHDQEEKQLQEFSRSNRRNIRQAGKTCEFKMFEEQKDIQKFLKIYYDSLKQLQASKDWYFSADFFNRVRESEKFKLAQVSDDQAIHSISLVIEHKLASYYFLTGNKMPRFKGANELLISGISIDAANHGIGKLILGGGNSSSADDPLLLFKQRFSKEPTTFYMGKLMHHPEIFAELCNEAIAKKSEIVNMNFFLKYRLL